MLCAQERWIEFQGPIESTRAEDKGRVKLFKVASFMLSPSNTPSDTCLKNPEMYVGIGKGL